jgi:hypothetical protein
MPSTETWIGFSRDLFRELAERGQNLGSAVSMLLRLLDTYGAQELQAAVLEALQKEVPHPHAVRQALSATLMR